MKFIYNIKSSIYIYTIKSPPPHTGRINVTKLEFFIYINVPVAARQSVNWSATNSTL